MAPILENPGKQIQRVPAFIAKQVKKGVQKLSSAPMKVFDTLPEGISKLNDLGKRMQVSDEHLKGWQLDSSVSSPAPRRRLRADFSNAPNHIWGIPRDYNAIERWATRDHFHPSHPSGPDCAEVSNCHTGSLGPDPQPSEGEKTMSPGPRTHPNWNNDPTNDLRRQGYSPVSDSEVPRRNDIAVYGIDENGNGRLDPVQPGQKRSEIQHSGTVVETSTRTLGTKKYIYSEFQGGRGAHHPYNPELIRDLGMDPNECKVEFWRKR